MKISRKPLHTRKRWKNLNVFDKAVYYMAPFLYHIADVWMQPLPFPTILKSIYSSCIFCLLLFPLLYPFLLLLLHYGVVQYIVEGVTEIRFPKNLDLLGYISEIIVAKPNTATAINVKLYYEKIFILGTSFLSAMDYLRIFIMILFTE